MLMLLILRTFAFARKMGYKTNSLRPMQKDSANAIRTAGSRAPAREPAPVLPDLLENPPGYTGTALELLKSGVPQVVAMRYEVGDNYARELAGRFYRRLFADRTGDATDSALALARTDLLGDKTLSGLFGAVDHATPLMFGHPGRILEPVSKRSEQMARIRPQPQPLLPGGNHELDRPADFVGRRRELTALNVKWLSGDTAAIVLVSGMAGMGKTVLAAEAVNLWHGRFDYVLAFQAKPTPLMLDDFYRQVDGKLTMYSRPYREKCEQTPAFGVFLEPGFLKNPDDRYGQMAQNLLDALRDEAILVVLDNFETCLEKNARKDGYACSDPRWDGLLAFLRREMTDTRSRLLVTSRHAPAALAGPENVLQIPLGTLSIPEARHYVCSHAKLRDLMLSDAEGRELARSLLLISRGHPLMMNRLAGLAGDRKALADALDGLKDKGWQTLPDLFAPVPEKDAVKTGEAERKYLEDAVAGSVDFLIGQLSPDARSLLWVMGQANEPVSTELIRDVWASPESPPIGPLLSELVRSGLVELTAGFQPAEKSYAFHELVRERADAWMETHESERPGKTREQIWVAYGERYKAMFYQLLTSGQENAMTAANEAGRRGMVYLVRAKAFEKMGDFASWLVTGTQDLTLLRGVIAELKAVADIVPAGRGRWTLRVNLADALRQSGCLDESLAFYEQAAIEAEATENWPDVGWICANWAVALMFSGALDKAKATLLRSADADRKSGGPKINIVGSELEAFRIDVFQGKAKAVLPDIESRLNDIRGWRDRQRSGETVAEAPEPVFLGRVLVAGLDIAKEANQRLENWEACLSLLKEKKQTEREMGQGKHEIYRTRFNQYIPLKQLGRLDEAQRTLEECLAVFREADDLGIHSNTLSALADIWNVRGDIEQAIALERRALSITNRLDDPADRAISHGNLSKYLDDSGRLEESAVHMLVGIIYRLIATRHDLLVTSLNNLRYLIRRAAQSGTRYDLPRISSLVSRPEFDALGRFLEKRGVDVDALQGQVDQLVEQVTNEDS